MTWIKVRIVTDMTIMETMFRLKDICSIAKTNWKIGGNFFVASLTLKNGNSVSLTEEYYEKIIKMLDKELPEFITTVDKEDTLVFQSCSFLPKEVIENKQKGLSKLLKNEVILMQPDLDLKIVIKGDKEMEE